MTSKKYYWLKLPDNFFDDKSIKKLRRIAGGDTYTVIYLKMLLKSLKDNGKIYYDGIEDSVAEEIALDLDEDPDNVMVTLNFLKRYGLLEESESDVMLTQLPEMVGCETADAARKRRARSNSKGHLEDKNGQSADNVQKCPTEIEIEKRKEIDTDKSECKTKRKRFVPPTRQEVYDYVELRGNKIDPDRWYDYYEANGWMVGKNHMKDWKAAVRTWEKNGYSNSPPKQQSRAGATFRDFEQRSYDYDDLQKKLGVFG